MKKLLAILLTLALSLSFTAALADTVTIGVPNDTTNEARALLLLQANGIIKLAMGSGIQATVRDIVENPYNVEIVEIEAAQLPVQLPDLDYAVINSNYAISADLNPVKDSLLLEGSYSAYGNILAVKEGTEESDKVKALVAALESKQVADFITETYNGSVVSTVENPTDGYDATVDYDALNGETIQLQRRKDHVRRGAAGSAAGRRRNACSRGPAPGRQKPYRHRRAGAGGGWLLASGRLDTGLYGGRGDSDLL